MTLNPLAWSFLLSGKIVHLGISGSKRSQKLPHDFYFPVYEKALWEDSNKENVNF